MEQKFSRKEEIEVILRSTQDGIIAISKEGIVTIFNASAEKITGIMATDVLGRKAEEVIPNTRLHEVLRTGIEEINKQQVLGNITINTNRMPIKDKFGNILGAMAVFRDVTVVKGMLKELTGVREVQYFLQAIINATEDAISVVDENGIGILINPAYTRITGLTEEDILNKPANVDIAEGDSIHMQVLRTKQPIRGVKLKVGPNKKEVMVNVAPIIINNKLKGSVGVIHDISEIKKLSDELEQFKKLIRQIEARYTFEDIIGISEEMHAAIEQARRAATTPATVLLRGESGSGKELFAHAIHNASNRRDGRFVRVNCASLSESLLESELFGYEAGAFTGALKGGKTGFFEEAKGGTIFLDEIGEISHHLQAKLLRVLQEKEIVRVGGTKSINVNLRVIAATNANLEDKIKDGSFRADLYYRLNVVPIFIPPLRRRKKDIELIGQHIINRYNKEYGRYVKSISHAAVYVLKNYDWPGNVRELENVLGRAIINMNIHEDVIQVHHLPSLEVKVSNRDSLDMAFDVNLIDHNIQENNYNLENILSKVENEIIKKVLVECKGNKTIAAKKLDISIRSLYYKLEKYKLNIL